MPADRVLRGRRPGTAMIEAAVVLPVLLLLLFGIMEVGRALMTYNLLTHSVRAGARLAVVKPDLVDGDSDILDHISKLLDKGGVTAEAAEAKATLTIKGCHDSSWKDGDPLRGAPVCVSAEAKFVPAVPTMVFKNSGDGIPLRAQVVARHE